MADRVCRETVTAAYGCTTDDCSERFRGFTDEPLHCSICLQDLTRFDGVTADYMNSVARAAPRPLPEVPSDV